MKKGIHPEMRDILFVDPSCEAQFLLKSTLETKGTGTFKDDGKEYPMVILDVSSKSHPIYTGKSRGVVKEGRAARFSSKFGGSFTKS